MSKKFKSKWFRVALEGMTSDKRTIKRDWIVQAAKNFKQELYGARIWLEHFRGMLPDSSFRAFGDVIALKSEEVVVDGVKKMALFAQIDPTSDLIAMNKARQKIYTSIEIDESFADTGEAYMVGLAVTDSPASLGTEMLAFCQQKPDASPFKDRHYSATSMFTEALETIIEFEEATDAAPGIVAGLFSKVTELLGKAKSKAAADDAAFSDIHQAVETLATFGSEQATTISTLQSEVQRQSELITALTTRLDNTDATQESFSEMLDKIPGRAHRSLATGDTGNVQTDC